MSILRASDGGCVYDFPTDVGFLFESARRQAAPGDGKWPTLEIFSAFSAVKME
jgi:hypothetical protein